jgi:hypothetical protein
MKRFICLPLSFLLAVVLGVVSCSPIDDDWNGNGNGEDMPAVFVCVNNGNDGNPGTKNSPVKTIQTALYIASQKNSTNISVTSGIYTPGSGLNSKSSSYQNSGAYINVGNLDILGGWNSDFTTRTGKSELDGNSVLNHVIWLHVVNNVTIDGFVIRGGNADAGIIPHNQGGGIHINLGSGHQIKNTVISNNSADGDGGGIFAYQSPGNTITATISDNTGDWGGGITIAAGTNNTINATVSGNTADMNGGGICVGQGSHNVTISGTISGNTAENGGGVFIDRGTGHTISATISNNTAGWGGGVCFMDGDINSTHSFASPVTIENNENYGVARLDDKSDPQGLDTIDWGSGNTPENINW